VRGSHPLAPPVLLKAGISPLTTAVVRDFSFAIIGGPERSGTVLARLVKVGRWLVLAVASLLVLCLLFVNVGPRFLPYQALFVRSGSMSPTIPTGSLVLYQKVSGPALKVGDVIVFDKPGDPSEKVTHRIYEIQTGPQGRYFLTKGDANASPDPWTVSATGTGWKEFWHVPSVGYVFGWLQTSSLRFLLIAIPAGILGVLALVDVRRSKVAGTVEATPSSDG
jgi:signal peptidase I